MQYRSFLTLIAAAIFLAAGSITILGQTAPASGTVEVENTDGSRAPVAGALIEIYRTDIKSGFPSVKTSKKGEFAIAGLMLGAEYTFSISGANIAPALYPKIKAGQERIVIRVFPGDGRKFTEEEARKGVVDLAANPTAEMSEEEKKARAEYEAQKTAVEAKNQKVQKSNEIIARAAKEGADAFNAKNYDLAIAKYTEGIDADPDFIGSAPIFYNNRGTVLVTRAVDSYNRAVKTTDPTEKVALLGKTRKDLADAGDGFLKAWNLLKTADPQTANLDANKATSLRGAKDALSKAVRTEQIDPSLVEVAKVMLPEVQAAETDATKKSDSDLIMADMYRVLGESENAVIAYRKILDTSPDNVDALAGVGFSLVNIGYLSNDKAKFQEGANFLQRFASSAPDTHKFKADAVALIEMLKKEQNVTPQKAPGKRKS
ncbi:MAG: carboxypeptidase regulatory-like domain-containing protein [Chloracidobacterium sp.]|nr:carboxypeptidase regulatory-like domain-containing protein [Chloracidobacterium sp.]